MTHPLFITFTGVDQFTDLDEMVKLSNKYPIEWGVLFSKNRMGKDNRYPTHDIIKKILDTNVHAAAHLCGRYAADLLDHYELTELDDMMYRFDRVQINTPARGIDFTKISNWALERMLTPILQHRLKFPKFAGSNQVRWLFDASGGKGKVPTEWPQRADSTMVGYAGGLTPLNIEWELAKMDTRAHYWIDMESGVRDNDDRFDLAKCRRVCEIVYKR